jgi:periplasmic protein TonB
MAYVSTNSGNSKAITLGAVALLHVAAGYALVNGLAGPILELFVPPPLAGYQIPNRPTPPPEPPKGDVKTDNSQLTTTATGPIVNTGPVVLFPTGPIELPPGTGGLDMVEFPQPIPTPLPSFAAKSTRPSGSPGLWVTPNDYPASELRLEHEGLTGFQVTVGANGRVTSCAITASSGWPVLDRVACQKITARARFEPASDTSGAVVPGTYRNSVRWEIPD